MNWLATGAWFYAALHLVGTIITLVRAARSDKPAASPLGFATGILLGGLEIFLLVTIALALSA